MRTLISVILGFLLVGLSTQQTPVDVEISTGLLRGQKHDDSAGTVYDEFLGVPFAAPPVGSLRWEKPTAPDSWEGVRDATSFSIHCTHFVASFYPLIGAAEGQHGEDCLYLNVWVPRGVDQVESLPVMVFYYGGGFIIGTGEMYPGSQLAVHGDVIVVNFNYRLSTLGWLSSGDDVLPGNFGLWDARAALQWVQTNIGQFGGDPSQVTIFGHSAGGAMVSHSVISPQFDGLFQRAIAISGGSSSFFALSRQEKGSLLMMSEIFGCESTDSQEIVDCLREFDDDMLDFWGIIGDFLMRGRLPSFLPSIDGEMVIGEPTEMFAQGYGKDIDFITGSTFHDGAGFILLNPIAMRLLGDKLNVAATQERLDSFFNVFFNHAVNKQELIDIVYDLYPDMITDDNMTRTLTATEFGTDMWFNAPSFYEASQHAMNSQADGGATYHYDYHFGHSFLAGYPDWVTGSHMDDMYTIFGEDFMRQYRQLFLRLPWLAKDRLVSTLWMSYLSNFAHTGNPNEGPNEVPVSWPEFVDASSERLVVSDDPHLETVDSESADLYNYFMTEFPSLIERPEFDGSQFNAEEMVHKVVALKETIASFVLDEDIKEVVTQMIDYFTQKGIRK